MEVLLDFGNVFFPKTLRENHVPRVVILSIEVFWRWTDDKCKEFIKEISDNMNGSQETFHSF